MKNIYKITSISCALLIIPFVSTVRAQMPISGEMTAEITDNPPLECKCNRTEGMPPDEDLKLTYQGNDPRTQFGEAERLAQQDCKERAQSYEVRTPSYWTEVTGTAINFDRMPGTSDGFAYDCGYIIDITSIIFTEEDSCKALEGSILLGGWASCVEYL